MKKQVILITSVLTAISCSSKNMTPAPTTPRSGPIAYMESDPEGNSFACATCHDLSEPSSDGLRRPGHPMNLVTERASYKNGQLSSLLDAVNTCREEWMVAPVWTEDHETWLNLKTWLSEQGAGKSNDDISFTIANSTVPPGTGDATTGQSVFNATCAACHGADGVGTILAPPLDGDLLAAQGGADYIVRRVRTSGGIESSTYSRLTGGRMPFWSVERLSDQELVDITAFLVSNDLSELSSVGVENTVSGFDEMGDCASTHASIGTSAELKGLFHQVAGTVSVVNDCTLKIENFTFDGQGIDVRFYGARDAAYGSGFGMGGDLRRAGGYNGETLYFVLPDGKTLDDMNSVSIWCVPAKADFGSVVYDP